MKRTHLSVVLALIVALAAVVRFPALASEPFWLDEMFSVWFSRQPLEELWVVVPRYETHPPLFYTVLKTWALAWNSWDEASLRTLSCLASVLCVPIAFVLVSRVTRTAQATTAGLAAALALAVNPIQIMYAREARPYALLSLSVGVTLLGLAWLYDASAARGRSAAPVSDSHGGTRPILARVAAALVLLAGLCATLWLHHTALVLVGTTVALLCLGLLYASPRPARDSVLLTAVGAIALLVWAPNWVWIHEAMTNPNRGTWLTRPGLVRIVDDIEVLLGGGGFAGWFALVRRAEAVAMMALTLEGLRKALRGGVRAGSVAAATVMFAPLVTAVIVSWTVAPLFLFRPLIWIAFGQAAAIGWYIALGREDQMLRRLLLFMALATYPIASFYANHEDRDPWPDIVRLLQSESGATSAVAFVPNFLEFPIRWYGGRSTESMDFVPMPAAFPALEWNRRYPSGLLAEPAVTADDLPTFAPRVADKDTVWLIAHIYPLYDRESVVFDFLVCSRGKPVVPKLPGNLAVWRFGPRLETTCPGAEAASPSTPR